MCELCGCGMGRPVKRYSIQQRTTKARVALRLVEIAEPSAREAVDEGEDGRSRSTATMRWRPISAVVIVRGLDTDLRYQSSADRWVG